MIYIEVKQSLKIKYTEYSAFIKFNFDTDVLNEIKKLYPRVYIPEFKCWETTIENIATIVNVLSNYEFKITFNRDCCKIRDVEIPSGFKYKTQPFKHQKDFVPFSLQNDNFLLGDTPGLGKTKAIIDLAVMRKLRGEIKRCLIICGVNGNKYNWEQEITIHSNEKSWILGTRYTKRKPIKRKLGQSKDKLDDLYNLPDDVLFIITNVETLRALSVKNDEGEYSYPIADRIYGLCRSGEIGMIAVDEIHKVRNVSSQQGQALLKTSIASFKVAMSGTFMMNNPLDFYIPLNWTGHDHHSFYQFKQHYCMLGGYGGNEVLGYKNLPHLRQTLEKVMIRRTKDQVFDLPPKIYINEFVEMYDDQQKVYDEVTQKIKLEIDKVRVHNDPLSQLIRMRQATGYPGILSSAVTDSAKMDRMVELVEEIVSNGEKCIVYSQWSQMTKIAYDKLKKFNPAYLTGETAQSKRMPIINKFQEDDNCKVIVGTIGALGTGYTLTKASTVIFLDEPWSSAEKLQAEDRAHRIGTTQSVNIVTLLAKDTIDERIFMLVKKKGEMSDFLVDGKIKKSNKNALIDYLLS